MHKVLCAIHSLMDDKFNKKRYFLIFTAAFGITALLVFSWFIFSGRTLLWKTDGWEQHSTALVYYGRYLRSIVKNLIFEHRLAIPEWDYTIGEGGDILNTLHYYVIGDPLNFLSVFVPSSLTHHLYSALMVLRLYLSGIAFSFLCFNTSRKNPWAVLAGALTYSFSGWALYCVIRHPFFITPIIYLPLLILGVEKIFKNQKPYVLIFSVFFAAVSNFYFFYMQVMLVIIYSLIRAVNLYKKDIKKIFLSLFHIGVPAFIGLLLAGVVLMPILETFLFDARMSTSHKWFFVFPMSFYSTLASTLVSDSCPDYTMINVAAPAILCAALIFRKKDDNKLFRALIIISLIFTVIPVFGQVFNGLSYLSNRWTFSLSLLYSYILVYKWDSIIHLDKKDSKYLFICTIVYFAVCIISSKSISVQTFSGICFLLISILIFILMNGNQKALFAKEVIVFLLIVAHISTNALWSYSDRGRNFVKDRFEAKEISEELLMTDATAVKWNTDEEEFVRYSGRNVEENKNMLHGISSAYYYWSLTNSNMVSFRDKLSLNDKYVDWFKGYDSRSALLALSSTNYFVTKASDDLPLPYGFKEVDGVNIQGSRTQQYIEELKKELQTDDLSEEQIKKIKRASNNSFYVYKNENALPIGYCYDKSITKEMWETMTSLERQEAMLKAVYIEDQNSVDPISDIDNDIHDIPYSYECMDSEITFENNRIVTTAPNQKIKLTFRGMPESETYVQITNLYASQTAEHSLYFGDESVDPQNLYNKTNWKLLDNSVKRDIKRAKKFFEQPATIRIDFSSSISEGTKSFYHHTENDQFAFGKVNYLVNIGYSKQAADTIEISFPTQGVYTFDSIDIACVPVSGFTEKVNALKADSLQNVEFGTNKVTGSLNASSDEVLCVTIPYSEGWTAYVDGEETETFHANEQYIGLNVSKGEHKIELRYSRPWKNLGYASTALGLVILAAYIVIERIKSAKSKSE